MTLLVHPMSCNVIIPVGNHQRKSIKYALYLHEDQFPHIPHYIIHRRLACIISFMDMLARVITPTKMYTQARFHVYYSHWTIALIACEFGHEDVPYCADVDCIVHIIFLYI
jgi:hypothetical protein